MKISEKVKDVGFCNTFAGVVKRIYYEFLYRKFRFDGWHRSPFEWRKYVQVTADYINLSNPFRVIDIGCGLGELLRHIKAEERIGYDIGKNEIKAARLLDKTKKIKFIQGFFDENLKIKKKKADYMVTLGFTHGNPESYWRKIYHKQLTENDVKRVIVDVFPERTENGQYQIRWENVLPAGYRRIERFGPFEGNKYLEVYEKI